MHVTRDLSSEVCVIRELFVLGREISFSWSFSNNNWFKTTIKFTPEISDTEITFLDTCVYTCKGKRFKKESIFDVRTHLQLNDIYS